MFCSTIQQWYAQPNIACCIRLIYRRASPVDQCIAVTHPQNFKRLFMGIESYAMFTGEFCAYSLTYQRAISKDL